MAAKNGKITFNLVSPISLTKNYYKVKLAGEKLGIRWDQTLYFPGQRSGKGLKKFKTAKITVVLEG